MKPSISLKRFGLILVLFALLLSACGPQEVLMPAPDSDAAKNNGMVSNSPISVPLGDLTKNCNGTKTLIYTEDEESEPLMIEICQERTIPPGTVFRIFDYAMIASIAIPEPVSDVPMFLIWSGTKLIKVAVVSTAAFITGNAISTIEATWDGSPIIYTTISGESIHIPVDPGHHTGHDVIQNVAKASAVITTFQTWMNTGGPQQNQRHSCYALMIGKAVARFMLWSKDGGTVLVWHAAPPAGVDPWLTIYGPKGRGSMLNVPEDIKSSYQDAHIETIDCNNLPPFPPLATN